MSERGSSIRDLPNALSDGQALNQRFAGRHPAVFLDYDGTLTPIVDRPEDANDRPITTAHNADRAAPRQRADRLSHALGNDRVAAASSSKP
jgi:hypothetical protein